MGSPREQGALDARERAAHEDGASALLHVERALALAESELLREEERDVAPMRVRVARDLDGDAPAGLAAAVLDGDDR